MAGWCGLEAADLKAGETLLLIGAGGGVGSAASQIARRLDARVFGADRRSPRPDAPINGIAEKLIIGADDLPAEIRAATGGKGADVVFDLVGGVMFCSAVNCLALGGRLVEIAATGQREVSFDLADFYHSILPFMALMRSSISALTAERLKLAPRCIGGRAFQADAALAGYPPGPAGDVECN